MHPNIKPQEAQSRSNSPSRKIKNNNATKKNERKKLQPQNQDELTNQQCNISPGDENQMEEPAWRKSLKALLNSDHITSTTAQLPVVSLTKKDTFVSPVPA